MTDEFLSFPPHARIPSGMERRRLDGEEREPEEGLIPVTSDEEAWLRLHLQHRNSLRLVAAGAIGFALALALGLSAAWQIDRWANDWHYGLREGIALPDHSAEPSLPIDPSAFIPPGEAA